jgi:TPR repeat protein
LETKIQAAQASGSSINLELDAEHFSFISKVVSKYGLHH